MKRPAVFVVVASAAFALSGPLARWGRPLHPLALAFGRVAIAGAVLAALDPGGVARSIARMNTRQRSAVALAGVLLAAHFGLFLWGLDSTSLPAAISLVSLEPFSVVLCAWAFYGARPTAMEQAGVIAATVGAVVVAQGAGAGDHRLAGDLMVVVAVLLYGLYVAVARGVRDALPARHYAALVYLGAALALVPALVVVPARASAVKWPMPLHSAVAVVALALVPTLVGHTAVQTAARSLPPSTIALVSPGETLGGLVIGALALRAVPSRFELVGALVIVFGSILTLVAARGPQAAS